MDENKINDSIGELVGKALEMAVPGSMLVKYTLVMEGMDDKGERFVHVVVPNDARAWDIYGLLNFVLANEQAHLSRHYPE